MLTTLLQLILISVIAGIAGDVFVRILTQEGHVLYFWRNALEWLAEKYTGGDAPDPEPLSEECNQFSGRRFGSIPNDELGRRCKLEITEKRQRNHKAMEKWNRRWEIADYIMKPILNCIYCVSGQIGFWSSIYFCWHFGGGYQLSDIPYSILTAFLAVYFGGLAQVVQRKLFPVNE